MNTPKRLNTFGLYIKSQTIIGVNELEYLFKTVKIVVKVKVDTVKNVPVKLDKNDEVTSGDSSNILGNYNFKSGFLQSKNQVIIKRTSDKNIYLVILIIFLLLS